MLLFMSLPKKNKQLGCTEFSSSVYTVVSNSKGGEPMRGHFHQRMCENGIPCAVAFGIGLVLSCFCPMGLILFIVAVMLVYLGVKLIRHCK
jgi:hypothetical protein